MAQVTNPPVDGLAVSETARGADAARWLRRSGLLIVAISAFGGVFPYFANGLGLPIDGYPDGAMTTWRTVLHLIPGSVGVLAGIYLLVWAHRSATAGLRAGAPGGVGTALFAIRSSLAAGAWFWIGAYLWGLVEPGKAIGTGGLAGTMHAMGNMSGMSLVAKIAMPVAPGPVARHFTTVSCVFTMGVCHWAVGALVLAGGLTALGVGLQRGPVARLASDGIIRLPAAVPAGR